MRHKIILSSICIILSLPSIWLINLFSYKFTVTTSINNIELHALSLGEYHTPVRQLRIIDGDGNEVVKLIAKSENAMMHTATIKEGLNLFNDIYLEDYNVLYPKNMPYSFLKGHKYMAIISWPIRNKRVYFTIN
jgi:hypothetical protein